MKVYQKVKGSKQHAHLRWFIIAAGICAKLRLRQVAYVEMGGRPFKESSDFSLQVADRLLISSPLDAGSLLSPMSSKTNLKSRRTVFCRLFLVLSSTAIGPSDSPIGRGCGLMLALCSRCGEATPLRKGKSYVSLVVGRQDQQLAAAASSWSVAVKREI